MSAILARNLTRVFGEGDAAVRAVSDVDLRVERGELVLLLGPSGSGKTTLVSMLGGLLRPTSGAVEVAGHSPAAEKAHFRLQNIGFVFQSFNLLPALNALENVALPLRLLGAPRRDAEARAAALLEDLGLGARLRRSPRVLSGGERQRVSLARALVTTPRVLLADEPTASLDTSTGREAMALIAARIRVEGQACLVVTHDARLTELADRILHLEDGRLRAG